LSSDSPQQLIDTLLYLNGLHFALRSGKEHRDLTIDQITVSEPSLTQPNYVITYKENISKTNTGGLKFKTITPKTVQHIDTLALSNPSRSHALLLLKYFDKRPVGCSNIFYLTPINSTKSVWYKNVPIGHNTLGKTVQRLCEKGGITGYKTNHSLRATCATRLFDKGVDEQLIMARTGHRSAMGVRSYKRVSEVHHYNTSVVIDKHNVATDAPPPNKKSNASLCNAFTFYFHEGSNVTINNYNALSHE